MSQLGRHPEIIKLAHDLGLPISGDCLARVRDHALRRARQLLEGFDPKSMQELQRVLANRLLVRIAIIETDEDVDRIAEEYADFSPTLRHCLRLEFLELDTEGITIEHEDPQPGEMRYLAVVDARGRRRARAHFTLWHEITHVLIMPEQLAFKAFRRAPTPEQIEKKPLEKAVDSIAGLLALYGPVFGPHLREAVARDGRLTFAAIEAAKAAVAPGASLLSTAIASVRMSSKPAALVSVDYAYKKRERNSLSTLEFDLGSAAPKVEAKLRAVYVVANQAAGAGGFAIRRNMRVPETSVLRRAYDSSFDVTLDAVEDQAAWETSADGQLPSLLLRVQAIRRGQYVYGLIEPVVAT